jgi:hypothetical protein
MKVSYDEHCCQHDTKCCGEPRAANPPHFYSSHPFSLVFCCCLALSLSSFTAIPISYSISVSCNPRDTLLPTSPSQLTALPSSPLSCERAHVLLLRIYRVYDSFKIVQCNTILMMCFLKYHTNAEIDAGKLSGEKFNLETD